MKYAKYLTLAAVVTFTSACSSGIVGNASYIDGRHEMYSNSNNALLGMRLSMDDIKTTRINDFLVINVQLRSKWPWTQDVKYRVHWFDLQGIEVEPERPAWNKIILTGKSEKTIKLTAPSSNVVRAKITVRD